MPAVLEFLEDTRVGRMPGWVLLAGGADLDEDEIEEVELWAPEVEEGSDISESSEEEDGPGPPPLVHVFLVFLLFRGREGVFSFLSLTAYGRKENKQGYPTLTGPG